MTYFTSKHNSASCCKSHRQRPHAWDRRADERPSKKYLQTDLETNESGIIRTIVLRRDVGPQHDNYRDNIPMSCQRSYIDTGMVRHAQQGERKRYKNATFRARRCLEHLEQMQGQNRGYGRLSHDQNRSDNPPCYLHTASVGLRSRTVIKAQILRGDKRHVCPYSLHSQRSIQQICTRSRCCMHCYTLPLRSGMHASPGSMEQSLAGVRSASKTPLLALRRG